LTRHRGVRLVVAIAAGGMLLELGWLVLDPKGDARRHLVDRTVRALDRLHDIVHR